MRDYAEYSDVDKIGGGIMPLSKLPTHVRLSDYRTWLTDCTAENHAWGDYKNDLRDTNENRKRYIKALYNACKYRDYRWLELYAPHLI